MSGAVLSFRLEPSLAPGHFDRRLSRVVAGEACAICGSAV